MVQICCVDGCDDTKDDVIYFKFPNSRTLKRKWLDAFKPLGKVTIDSVICSRHFLDDQYEMVRGKKRLKAKVIPSIFNGNQNKPPIIASSQENNAEIPAETNENCSTDKTSPEHRDEECKVDNTIDNEDSESIVRRTDPRITAIDSEANNDIEDIITNYHIKQIRPLKIDTDIQKEDEEIEDMIRNYQIKQKRPNGDIEIEGQGNGEIGNGEIGEKDMNIIDVDELKDPVFIEVSVDKGGEDQPSQDCLMLLESVQCEVDPSSLMFQDNDHEADADSSSDVVDLGEKKEDPISLLTSSDEDEVIIEEPKIDTVEVSDETDEDDMPLVKLVDKRPTKSKRSKSTKSKSTKSKIKLKPVQAEDNIAKIMWGMYDYYCVECHFRTTNRSEYKRHKTEHATVLQICQICSYTTASKAQFARHKRKHQEERKFKCHLCDYKARHNMSLIYHMKSHKGVSVVNSKYYRRCNAKVHKCSDCNYETKRTTDLRRHIMRRHEFNEDDDNDYVPP